MTSLDELFTVIANVIRLKSGKTEPIIADNFPEEILNIGGGNVAALIDGSVVSVNDATAQTVGKYAFCDCNSLKTARFDRATSIGLSAFYQCSALETVIAPKVTSVGDYAFKGSAVKWVDLPAVTSFGEDVFRDTVNLEEINMPAMTTIKAYSFDGSGLKKASFALAQTVSGRAFYNCARLTDISLPVATKLYEKTFYSCSSLVMLDLPSATSIVNGQNFAYCYSLKALILRSETLCTINKATSSVFGNSYHFLGTVDADYNPDGLKDGYIYVPRALIEDYKVATNWVTLDTQFRALEDYTVDGTVTGALDETKI